jgi:hypothetical protein
MNLTVWIKKIAVLIVMAPKNLKKILNFLNFILHHFINTLPWFELISHPFHHIFNLFFTHTMYSSNSSKIEDQLTITFQGIIEEVMSILQAKEPVTAAASLSTRGSNHHRWYVNHDREAAHFRLRHNYFNDDWYFRTFNPTWSSMCGTSWTILMYLSI